MAEKKEIKVAGKKVILNKKSVKSSSSDVDKHIKFLYSELTTLRDKLEKVLVRMGFIKWLNE
jgi:hypothetical protein